MPIGVITNCLSLVIGGLIGLLLRSRISDRLKFSLPLIFGIISMAMGIIGILKVHHLPAVTLSLLAGTLLGELFQLEVYFTLGRNDSYTGFTGTTLTE